MSLKQAKLKMDQYSNRVKTLLDKIYTFEANLMGTDVHEDRFLTAKEELLNNHLKFMNGIMNTVITAKLNTVDIDDNIVCRVDFIEFEMKNYIEAILEKKASNLSEICLVLMGLMHESDMDGYEGVLFKRAGQNIIYFKNDRYEDYKQDENPNVFRLGPEEGELRNKGEILLCDLDVVINRIHLVVRNKIRKIEKSVNLRKTIIIIIGMFITGYFTSVILHRIY